MNKDINILMLNHEQQGKLIRILQNNIAGLQKEKQALMRENEALRYEIKDLESALVANDNRRQDRLILQRIINIGM